MAATHVVQLATYDTPQVALAVRQAAKRDGITVARLWVGRPQASDVEADLEMAHPLALPTTGRLVCDDDVLCGLL